MTHVEILDKDNPVLGNKALQDRLDTLATTFVDQAGDPLFQKMLDRLETIYGKECRDLMDHQLPKLIFQAGLMSGFANAAMQAGHMEVERQLPEEAPEGDAELKEAIGEVFNHILNQPK